MAGLMLELARMTGRSETLDTWLDRFGEDVIDELLVDSVELGRFQWGPGMLLCSYLDRANMELGENSQFLRLSVECFDKLSWKVIKYRCQLANESESFYRCVSVQEQFLRTVIAQNCGAIEIHSNVVPRQAYLNWLARMNATCPGHELCTRGFFPTSALLRDAEPTRQCCGNCTLVEQLRRGAPTGAAVVRFWKFLKTGVIKTVDGHASLGNGGVAKIVWRRGIFVRKQFHGAVGLPNLHFSREISVAMNVSHPNIVHYFGYSLWPDGAEHCDLFMELLEGDLEKLLLEGARTGENRLSFRDSLQVLLQIAEAMRHVHEKIFVHGDLKPGNVLMSKFTMPHSDAKFYLVKVADFGCAQSVDSNSGETVQPFDFRVGTLLYTAPEVLRCRMHGGPLPQQPQKIDVYSFGVTAFQVITGVTRVYPKGLRGLREGVISGAFRPDRFNRLFLQTLDDNRSFSLSFIQSCWAANPGERPSFAEICERLKFSIRYD